jgi:hypothetical protein
MLNRDRLQKLNLWYLKVKKNPEELIQKKNPFVEHLLQT